MRTINRLALVAAIFISVIGSTAIARNTVPDDVELPIQVRLSIRVLNIVRVQETLGEIGGTVEITQRWTDPATRFDRIAIGAERIDLVGTDAETRLTQIWSPGVVIENMTSAPRAQSTSLSIFHDGRVVLLRRFDAEFRISVSMNSFPFDRQAFPLSFVTPRHASNEVILTTTEFDRQFSSINPILSAANWLSRHLTFSEDRFYGWNSRPFSRLTSTAEIDRNWGRYVLRVFVPYFAIMSLSLFLLWAPERVISNTQRAPMVFSSLLALAALSFTFESSFPGSISMNSPIATMISMGYFYLVFVLLLDFLLNQHSSALAVRYPSLLPAARKNLRMSVPLVFFGLCLVVMLG